MYRGGEKSYKSQTVGGNRKERRQELVGKSMNRSKGGGRQELGRGSLIGVGRMRGGSQ